MLYFAQIPYAEFPEFSLLCSDYAQLCPIMPANYPFGLTLLRGPCPSRAEEEHEWKAAKEAGAYTRSLLSST